jgi:parallel beta-helix repeat protein
MRRALAVLLTLLFSAAAWGYDIPADRRIVWSAGLDAAGGIPTYPEDTDIDVSVAGDYYCDPTGTADCTVNLNAAIQACTAGYAVVMPAGTYRVDGDIVMKSQVALRGAGAGYPWLPTANAAATTLNMNGSKVTFQAGASKNSNWSPGASTGTDIASGYTQGSTEITLSDATGYAANDWISIYQDKEAPIAVVGGSGTATWLGEDNSAAESHNKQQYAKITGKVSNTLTLSRPIYYVTTNGAALDPEVRKQTFNCTMAGIEDLKLKGDGTNTKLVLFYFNLYCWAKNVETYDVSIDSDSRHIQISFSHGIEVRGSYCHVGETNISGRNYGIVAYWWNSDLKIEDNIVSQCRHGIVLEGGGSGCAILYNYIFDCWEDESAGVPSDSLTSDALANHGAFPHMNLWEGNVVGALRADFTWGTSALTTFYRNWSKAYRSTPAYTYQIFAIQLQQDQWYYNIVGNVLGRSAWTTGTVLDNGPGAIPAYPIALSFGRRDDFDWYDSDSYDNAIVNGNYDYITDGVATWLSADHALAASLYYGARPAFFGGVAWPVIGPDCSPVVNKIPAEYRYLNEALPSAATGGFLIGG